MGKLGMECGKDMYYDHGTGSCAYCSQLCHLVDIQGTRESCESHCPGYLTSSTSPWEVTTSPPPVPSQSSPVFMNPWTIASLTVLSIGVVVLVSYILYKNKKWFIKKLKRQDCCGEGESKQPHVQEIGSTVAQPEAEGLLANGREGFPDMPNRSMSQSTGDTDLHRATVPKTRHEPVLA